MCPILIFNFDRKNKNVKHWYNSVIFTISDEFSRLLKVSG